MHTQKMDMKGETILFCNAEIRYSSKYIITVVLVDIQITISRLIAVVVHQ